MRKDFPDRFGVRVRWFRRWVALVFASVVFSGVSLAQPDGQFSATLTSAASTTAFSNPPSRGCLTWQVSYVSNGFSALTLTFQSAQDSSGVPGSWGTYGGTTLAGANPMTATTSASFAGQGFFPWLRVTLSGLTGTGSVAVSAYCWRFPPAETSSGGGGAANVNIVSPLGQTVMASSIPVVVASNQSAVPVAGSGTAGAAAAGVVSVQGIASMTPVQVSQATAANLNATVTGSGTAGAAAAGVVSVQGIASMTPVQVSQPTASNLNAAVVGAGASGAAIAGNPVRVGMSDGTNTQNLFGCTLSAAISTNSSGSTQIVAASGSSSVRICHVSLAAASAVNVKLVYGTGANCVTSPSDLTGAYQNAVSLALDFPVSQLATPASQALCVNLSSGVQIGGVVVYGYQP